MGKNVIYKAGDDLKLKVRIEHDGEVCDAGAVPFEIEVRTEWPEPVLRAGWDGERCWGGCKLKGEWAVVRWDAPGLRSGALYGKITFMYPDGDMADGVRRETVEIDMRSCVRLWFGKTSVEGVVEHDAVVGRSAYQIAVAHGFEGSEEEWLESLSGADKSERLTELGVDEGEGKWWSWEKWKKGSSAVWVNGLRQWAGEDYEELEAEGEEGLCDGIRIEGIEESDQTVVRAVVVKRKS